MPGESVRVERSFPNTKFRISEDLWAIGTDLPTPGAVCEKLGIHENINMVVIAITTYYGRYDMNLWQTLEAWDKT